MSATLLMFHPKCAHCDETFPAGAQFCVHCGRPIHTTDEELGPPAQVRPLRPSTEEDSFRLPEPPTTSALSPLATDSLLLKAPASQPPAPSSPEALPADPAPQTTSAVQAKDGARDSWDEDAPSFEEQGEEGWAEAGSLKDAPSASEAMSEEESEDEDDALIVPPERSFRPWLVKGGALLALVFLVYLVWPKESVEQSAPTPQPSLSQIETPPPAPAKIPEAAAQPEEAPDVKEAPAKPRSPKRAEKPSRNRTPNAAPQPSVPKSGALKPSDVAPKLPLDDASTPSPAPKETSDPKPATPSHTEAADEAADFLTGE